MHHEKVFASLRGDGLAVRSGDRSFKIALKHGCSGLGQSRSIACPTGRSCG
jgi:hypothetical protein